MRTGVIARSSPVRVSFVVTARNDNHGGNLLRRMQIFVTGLLDQARRFGLESELILVEWNPPADRPRLADALTWPETDGPCRVRIVEVPESLHRRFLYADRLPLFQMIAKNAGIRRARGEFVLATNIDLLFNDDLVRFLASGELERDCMYRIDRHDVPADVPVGVTVEAQLEYCRRNVIRVNARDDTFERVGKPLSPAEERLLPVRVSLRRLRRLRDSLPSRVWPRVGLRLALLYRYQLFREVLGRKSPGVPALHVNACGDFTLLHRDWWSRLHGYPEWRVFSMHLDSMLCFAAHYAGAREVVLGSPCRLYHIEHGSGWTPQGAVALEERIAKLGLPMIDMRWYQAFLADMARREGPTVYNGEDWGMASEELPETVPTRAHAPGMPAARAAAS